MKIKHILKRTSQLTDIEKSQFVELRSKIFSSSMTAVQFDRKYTQTPIGYSYHGLMIADDSIDSAIKYIHRMLGGSVDLLVFVGRLPFRSINMIRIPKVLPRSHAKRAYVCGKILNHQIIDDRILNQSNWNLNYSDNDMP